MHVAWYAVWENRGSIEYTEDKEALAREIGAMVGGVMLTALLFELLDAKSGDIKTWVKGRLEDTTFITKINTTVENTITKVFSKADQFALLSGKVEKVLESLKANLSEEAFEYLANNLRKDQISDLMEAVRKLEKELGSTEIKLSEAQVKKLLEGLKDGKGVDSMVAELKTWCEKYSHKQDFDGLNKIKSHLTNDVDGFEFKPNEVIVNEIEEMLANDQKLTGAYKDFYEHELTESALMEEGYSYKQAHNKALEIHNVEPQALYPPQIVKEYSKWFNKKDYEYWGITIDK